MTTHLKLTGANGIHLHALSAGERGPLILFLHGFPEFCQAWHRQLAEFSPDFRAVALDLRGYNLSDKPKGTNHYALPNIINDIRQVLQSLSPGRRAILVGHDWGGIAAWALAWQSPALLERLVIINAPHPKIFFRELKQNWPQRFASSYVGFFQLRGVSNLALRLFDFALLRHVVFGISAKPWMFNTELRAAYRAAWSQPRAVSCGLNYYRNVRAFKRVLDESPGGRISVPTLVLWGEKDPALLRGNLVGLEHYVSDLTVRRHSSGTHWIVHEEPEWVNHEIRDFLSRPRLP